MRGIQTTKKDVENIRRLRSKGLSISEIQGTICKSKSVISKYIKGVSISPKYLPAWEIKYRDSIRRSHEAWCVAENHAKKLLHTLSKRDKIVIASCLYWGEGTKRELGFSNTDPELIKTFIAGLRVMGLDKERLRVNIRIYEDINAEKAIQYWARIVDIPKSQILSVNVLHGKKQGKLPYGMCRVRVTKGAEYFKILMSVIKQIGIKMSS
jgi:hypothetical protein